MDYGKWEVVANQKAPRGAAMIQEAEDGEELKSPGKSTFNQMGFGP